MGIDVQQLLRRPNRISETRTFTLTQSGTAKAEEMANDLETRVLTAIDEVSPGTIGAIEAECGIRRRKLEKVIKHLHRIGLISSTREHSGSGDE